MNQKSQGTSSWPTFVVVAHALAAVRFGINNPLDMHLLDYPTSLGPLEIDLRVRTPYVDEGYGTRIPRGVECAVRGKAPSLEEAMSVLGNVGAYIAPVIALSANAAVSDGVVWLAYDVSPDVDRHPYYQLYMEPDRSLPSSKRRVDVEAAVHLLRAVIGHPDSNLLSAAMGHYQVALNHLKPGQEILVLAHLYMAADTLTNAAIRWLYIENEVPHGDKTRLARALGVKGEALRDTVRELVVFEGDAECYKVVKEASDGFEHGFMPLDQIRSRALIMRDQTIAHLRSAILTIARLDDVVRAQLMDRPFDFPYPDIGLVKYVKGAIVGKPDNLAADGYEYPLLQWQTTPQATMTDTPGTYSITFQDRIEPIIAPQLSFELHGHGTGGLTDRPVTELEPG